MYYEDGKTLYELLLKAEKISGKLDVPLRLVHVTFGIYLINSFFV